VKHQLIKIENCPICEGNKFNHFLSVIDHNVSNSLFNVVECENCTFKITNPRPSSKTLPLYYKSSEYISHTSSKKGLFNKAYHIVRKYQLSKKYTLIKKLINKNNEPYSILDIGCGTGDFLNYCQKKGCIVSGVETEEKAAKLARIKYNLTIDDDINSLMKNNNMKFHVITLWHVLEHIEDINEFTKKVKSLLHKDGYLILGLPNNCSYDAKTYKENWFAWDVPIHLSHFNKKNIIALSEKHCFMKPKIFPLIFDSYYISLLSEKKKGGSIIKGIITGLKSNLLAKRTSEYSGLIYALKKL